MRRTDWYYVSYALLWAGLYWFALVLVTSFMSGSPLVTTGIGPFGISLWFVFKVSVPFWPLLLSPLFVHLFLVADARYLRLTGRFWWHSFAQTVNRVAISSLGIVLFGSAGYLTASIASLYGQVNLLSWLFDVAGAVIVWVFPVCFSINLVRPRWFDIEGMD